MKMKPNGQVVIFDANITGFPKNLSVLFMLFGMEFAYLVTFIVLAILRISSNRSSSALKLCQICSESNSKSSSMFSLGRYMVTISR